MEFRKNEAPHDIWFTNIGAVTASKFNLARSLKAPGLRMSIKLADGHRQYEALSSRAETDCFYPEAYERFLRGSEEWKLLGFQMIDCRSEKSNAVLFSFMFWRCGTEDLRLAKTYHRWNEMIHSPACCKLINEARRLEISFDGKKTLLFSVV